MSLFSDLCPRCKNGKIFKDFVTMNELCPQCAFKFSRGPGYFTGALFINYMFLAISTIPTLLLALYLEAPPLMAGIIACMQIVILSPFSLRYSRLVWLQSEYRSNPEE